MSQCEQFAEIRICTSCASPLPPDQFYRVPYGEGLARECKKCRLLREKIRYQKNREEVLTKKREKYHNETQGFNIIDEVDKMFQKEGICWLSFLRKWHENKFGGKKDGKDSKLGKMRMRERERVIL